MRLLSLVTAPCLETSLSQLAVPRSAVLDKQLVALGKTLQHPFATLANALLKKGHLSPSKEACVSFPKAIISKGSTDGMAVVCCSSGCAYDQSIKSPTPHAG